MTARLEQSWIPVTGSHLTNEEAQIAGRIIDKMRTRGTHVTAESFFEACRKDKHGRALFNWNRNEVLREAWLDRARYIIRSITVTVTRIEAKERTIVAEVRRAFVPVTEEIKGKRGEPTESVTHYVGIEEAMAVPTWKTQVLERALAEANGWARRYEHLKECEKIVRAIDEAQGNVRARRVAV